MTDDLSNPVPLIQEAKHAGNLRYSGYALVRMIERAFSSLEVESALDHGRAQVIENSPNPETLVSPSCTVLGWNSEDRPLHVRVAYRVPEVVTVYEPVPPTWATPFKRGTI